MDIQLQVTDEELKEFPEDKPDQIDLGTTPSNISLPKADLPIPPFDLPVPPSSLPIHRARCKAKRKAACWEKNPIDTQSATLLDECLPVAQPRGTLIHPSALIHPLLSCNYSLICRLLLKPLALKPFGTCTSEFISADSSLRQ